jgi:hypothetical protein
MAGMYPLPVNGTLIVPTRRPDLNATVVAGNLAQCKPVISSNTTTFPGQYPVAAVDSSNGTAWQPSLPDPSFIIVDLEVQQSLSGVHINWAALPARSFEVLVGDDPDAFTSVVSMDVEISAPYNETLAASVEIFLGNITDAQFNATGRYSLVRLFETHSRYVQLVVNGTYGDETVGATVAEFAVL